MAAEEEDVGEVGDTPDVGKDCTRLDHVDKAIQSVGLEEAWRSQQRVKSDVELDEVERQQRDDVQHETTRARVAQRQSAQVVNDQAALEVPGPGLDRDVDDIDEVGQSVGGEPQWLDSMSQLRESLARDARPEIIEYSGSECCHPAEHEMSVGRDDVVTLWPHRGRYGLLAAWRCRRKRLRTVSRVVRTNLHHSVISVGTFQLQFQLQ